MSPEARQRLREEIKGYMQFMFDQEVQSDGNSPCCWTHPDLQLNEWGLPDPAVGTCTNGARILARKFGGKVMGFEHEDNPTAKLAEGPGGHDFAVIDDFIVDYWAVHYSGELPVGIFDLNDPADQAIINENYGDRSKWEELPLLPEKEEKTPSTPETLPTLEAARAKVIEFARDLAKMRHPSVSDLLDKRGFGYEAAKVQMLVDSVDVLNKVEGVTNGG